MSETFDGYHKWLGIRQEEQPADFYRLLGINQFENDPEVIANAADQRMAHLRVFQAGPHADLSQKILNEIATARVCLLNPAKKARYDGQLERLLAALRSPEIAHQLPTAIPSPPPPSPVVDAAEVLSGLISSSPSRRTSPAVMKKRPRRPAVIAAIVAALIVFGAAVTYIKIGNREFAVRQEESATNASSHDSTQDGQEDARNAERLKAEDARRRQTAEEAQEKAAEAEKQRQEREAEDKLRTAAVATPLREADLWKAKAERYASGHRGHFFKDLPLTEGKAEIPREDLPRAPAGTTWFLGNGRIYLENGTYPFGDDPGRGLPEVRYEIPALARELRLKSVFVELRQGGDVLRLEVGGVPADPPGGNEADKKARMEDLGRRINMLTSKLGTYRRTNTPAGKRDEAFQAIIELAQIEFSPVPRSPDPGNPKYHSRPGDRPDVFNRHLFDADLNAHNDAKSRNEATRSAVPETAAQRLREYEQQFDSLKYESRPATSQVRRENDPSLAALRKGCRSISVLIYQPMSPEGTPPVSPDGHAGDGSPGGDLPTAEQTGAGADRVDPAGVAARADTSDLDLAAAGNVPAIDGVFDVKKRPMTGLRATDTKVKFTVTAQGGLPSRLRQSAVIDSLLIEKNEQRKGRAHETPVYVNNKEKVEPMTTVIQQDAVSLSATIRFFRRSGDPFQPRGKLVAVSAVHSIEPVEEKSEYTVRFEISAAGLDKLMRLLDGH